MTVNSTRPLPSLPRRVLAVFIAPGPLFRQLRDQPVRAGAIGVVTAVTMMTAAEAPDQDMLEQMAADTVTPLIQILYVALEGAFAAIAPFIAGALAYWFFAKLLRDQGRYRQYVSVAAHADIVFATCALAWVLLAAPDDRLLMPTFGNVAFFLDEGFLLNFLSELGVITLWWMVLLALGFSRIHPPRRWESALAIMMVPWLLRALLAALA